MGVSFSSAFWSPSLQARSSVLMSPAAGSPGCAALCIASDYTAAPGFPKLQPLGDHFLAHSTPSRLEAHMKSNLTLIAASSLLATLALAQTPSYTVTDLGAVGPNGQPFAITNN